MTLEAYQLAVVATPILLVLMVVENAVRKGQGLAPYSQRQTLNNLGVFIGWRAITAAIGLMPLWGYGWMFDHLAPWQMDLWSPWTWVVGFFLVDFAFWARHWGAHRVGVLWMMHAVHHQSREYNLSAAARLSWFSDTVIVGIPLAIVGLPLEVTTAFFVAGNVWQLFQHTEIVGKLGVLDRWLVTPANHRVHHGCNEQYLDRNYGSILLVWDRLFSTFEPEEEQVRYGTLSGLKTYDATENNLQPLRSLIAKIRGADNLGLAFQFVWRPPGWVPGQTEESAVMVDDPEPQRAKHLSQRVRHISTTLIVVTMVASLGLVWNTQVWVSVLRVSAALAILFAVALSGLVLDSRPCEPVSMPTLPGRVQAQLSAWLLTLAGPYAHGPIYALGTWLEPNPRVRR